MFRPGQVIGGRYEVLVLIGERSLAAVFRARDRQTGREIALKAVRPNFITRVGAQAMQREAQVAAMIGQNPTIVEALDIGYDDALGTPYIIMPLLTGETLQQRIARAGPVPPEEVQKYAGQLGHALDKAHQVGVVHAALSPSKLFLTRDARSDLVVKILDFGVAKVLDNHPQAAMHLSHTAYIAPEQLGAEPKRLARSYGARVADAITGATDIWAVGLIAYEALVGAQAGAFWGVSQAQEIAMRIVQRPPVPSKAAGAAAAMLPPGFDEWFKRCVHLEPAKRYARASDACNELVTLLDAIVPRPSTALGGAIPTFVVGGIERSSAPTPSPGYVATPPPVAVPVAAPVRQPARILETALAIDDHEVSRIPPVPRGPSLHDAPPAPPKGSGLMIVVIVLGIGFLGVVGLLVAMLMKK